MAQRILLISLSNIGDAIMTTPVLERLHQIHPQAVIDILADPRSSGIFDHCPYRGDIILKHKRQGVIAELMLIHRLRRWRYDLVVDLRTDGLAWLLRARRRYTKRGVRPRGPHAVEQHMGVIAALGGDIPPTRVWLSKALRADAARRVAGLPGRRWLALGVGANWPPKIWPAAHFHALVTALASDFDAVLLLGGPGDRERAEDVARDCPLPCLNLAGGTGLLEAAAVLEHARAFVGNDSGLGHLASAVGTPTLAVFGPGRPARYHPWGAQATWLEAPDGDLAALDAGTVANALRRHLAGLAGPARPALRG